MTKEEMDAIKEYTPFLVTRIQRLPALKGLSVEDAVQECMTFMFAQRALPEDIHITTFILNSMYYALGKYRENKEHPVAIDEWMLGAGRDGWQCNDIDHAISEWFDWTKYREVGDSIKRTKWMCEVLAHITILSCSIQEAIDMLELDVSEANVRRNLGSYKDVLFSVVSE